MSSQAQEHLSLLSKGITSLLNSYENHLAEMQKRQQEAFKIPYSLYQYEKDILTKQDYEARIQKVFIDNKMMRNWRRGGESVEEQGLREKAASNGLGFVQKMISSIKAELSNDLGGK